MGIYSLVALNDYRKQSNKHPVFTLEYAAPLITFVIGSGCLFNPPNAHKSFPYGSHKV